MYKIRKLYPEPHTPICKNLNEKEGSVPKGSVWRTQPHSCTRTQAKRGQQCDHLEGIQHQRVLLSRFIQCPCPRLADADRAAEGMLPSPLGRLFLLCRPWRSSAASLNESLKLPLCPSRQFSLGWHPQGNTLGQVWIRSSEVPSSQRSSLLTHLVELCEHAARTAPEGIPLRQIFCSHEQVTMLNVLLVSQTFIF